MRRRKSAYPVDIEDVDVVCTELLEGGGNGHMQRLHVVPNIVRLLGDTAAPFVVGRVLCP